MWYCGTLGVQSMCEHNKKKQMDKPLSPVAIVWHTALIPDFWIQGNFLKPRKLFVDPETRREIYTPQSLTFEFQ